MSRRRKSQRFDAFETLCQIGDRLGKELNLPVRYIESMEHNGQQWTLFDRSLVRISQQVPTASFGEDP